MPCATVQRTQPPDSFRLWLQVERRLANVEGGGASKSALARYEAGQALPPLHLATQQLDDAYRAETGHKFHNARPWSSVGVAPDASWRPGTRSDRGGLSNRAKTAGNASSNGG